MQVIAREIGGFYHCESAMSSSRSAENMCGAAVGIEGKDCEALFEIGKHFIVSEIPEG